MLVMVDILGGIVPAEWVTSPERPVGNGPRGQRLAAIKPKPTSSLTQKPTYFKKFVLF